MSDFAKNFSKTMTDTIFSLTGDMYKEAVRALVNRGPDEIKKALVYLVQQARVKSGLAPVQSLRLIKMLRDVLHEVIDREENQSGPQI